MAREIVDSCRFEFLGNLAQHQRLHRDFAIVEKGPLIGHDGFGDTLDGGETLFDVADQPAGLLKLLGHRRAVVATGAAKQRRIGAVQARPRHDRRIGRDDPLALHLANDDIRHDMVGVRARELDARLGVETAYQPACGMDGVVAAAQPAPQFGRLAPGQQVQVIAGEGAGKGHAFQVVIERVELQAQALRQVAGAQAGRIQLLDYAQGHHPLFVRGGGGQFQRPGDILECLPQIAVVVERLHQRFGQQAVALGEPIAAQFAAQVVPKVQRHGRPVPDVFGIVIAVVAAGIAIVGGVARGVVAVLRFAAVVFAVLDGRVIGAVRLGRRGRIAGHGGGVAMSRVILLLVFKKGIVGNGMLQFLGELECRHLQQLDRLLQARRQRQLLARPHFINGLYHGFSPE